MKVRCILVVMVSLLITACGDDPKVTHFKNKGTLLCVDKNWFSEDDKVFINYKNAKYNEGITTNHSAKIYEGFSVDKSGFFDQSFELDDCSIIHNSQPATQPSLKFRRASQQPVYPP